jgi:hypothetical protein
VRVVRPACLSLAVALLGVLPAVLSPPAGAAPAPGRLSGLVQNDHGVPLPGATVVLTGTSGGPVAARVVADGAGRYQVGVPTGDYDLAVAADSAGRRWGAKIENVAVAADSTLDIAVVRPAHLRGTVRDAAGNPVSGAFLTLNRSAASARTGADGTFVLTVIPGKYTLEVRGGSSDSLGAWVDDYEITGDQTADILFPVQDVRVAVSDPTGERVGAAEVRLSGGASCREPVPGGRQPSLTGRPQPCTSSFDLVAGRRASATTYASGFTDTNGLVTLRGLATADLTGSVGGSPMTVGDAIAESFPIGDRVPARIDVVLRPTVALSGRMSIFGQPAQSQSYLSNERTSTSGGHSEADGDYRVNGPVGRYQLWTYVGEGSSGGGFRHGSVSIADFHLPAGGRTLDMDIPGTPFPVRVVDAAGNPVPGASVSVTGSGPDSAPVAVEVAPGVSALVAAGSSGITRSDGTLAGVVLAGAPSVRVEVTPVSGTEVTITATVAASAEGMVVTLPPVGHVAGRVRDGAGNPFPGITMTFVNPSDPARYRDDRTDGEGRFSLAAGTTGRGTLTLRYDNDSDETNGPFRSWSLTTNEADLPRGRDLELTTPAAGAVNVRVVGTDGRDKAGSFELSMVGQMDTALAADLPARLTTYSEDRPVTGKGVFRPEVFGAARYDLEWSPPFGATPSTKVHAAGLALDRGSNLVLAVGEPFGPSVPPVDPGAGSTTTTTSPAATPPAGDDTRPGGGVGKASTKPGYWMLAADGQVYPFGTAERHGDVTTIKAADLEPTPTGKGYWVVNEAGVVGVRGDARHLGNADPTVLARGEKVTSLSATPDGAGYWIFTTRGRAMAFGTAKVLGDVSEVALNGPVLDSVPTPSGNGYYMVASDGGIFAFGDARYAGSMGGQRLNAPVQSLVPDGDGNGYWLVASDGGIFAFGAPFKGSLGAVRLNRPITGMVRFGDGYLMVGEDGGIFSFSNLPFAGSLGASPPAAGVVSVAAVPY